MSTHKELAIEAREAARTLQTLSVDVRKNILTNLADLLVKNTSTILVENQKDIDAAKASGLDENLLARLFLSPSKIETLAHGLRQISAQDDPIGKLLRKTEVSEGLVLRQISVPLGVLLVIFESRPDALPQIAALSIYSGNGLLLKGGKEAVHSNAILHQYVKEAITSTTNGQVSDKLVTLFTSRDDISALLKLDTEIDLVIPRGSGALVSSIQNNTKIPVMGHAEGICHTYVDKYADVSKVGPIVVDGKTDYPAACNATETLLLHVDTVADASSGAGIVALQALQNAGVTMYGSVKAQNHPNVKPFLDTSTVADFKSEYGDNRISVELVDTIQDACNHINKYGSGHTESIITEDAQQAQIFQVAADGACVFVNASTRFADGFRFGLGAEVGISTSRIHARGPVGIEGLTSTKWLMESTSMHTVKQFANKEKEYTHKKLF